MLSATQAAAILYLAEDYDTEELYTVNTTTAVETLVGDGDCEGLSLSSNPSTFLYCVDGDETLYTVATNGSGRTYVADMDCDADRGLAYNTTTNVLYGADNNNFVSINTTTGACTSLDDPDVEDMEALAADPINNLIYGLENEGDLMVYDVGFDSWSTVGDTGIDGNDAGLAFDPINNILYAVDQDGVLYSINPDNAATTTIGTIDTFDDDEGYDFGLTFDPTQQVSTMNEWGMIIFMVLAGLGSLYYLRRKRVKG